MITLTQHQGIKIKLTLIFPRRLMGQCCTNWNNEFEDGGRIDMVCDGMGAGVEVILFVVDCPIQRH